MYLIAPNRRLCVREGTMKFPVKSGCNAPEESQYHYFLAAGWNVTSPVLAMPPEEFLQAGFPGVLGVYSILGSRSAGLHPAHCTSCFKNLKPEGLVY